MLLIDTRAALENRATGSDPVGDWVVNNQERQRLHNSRTAQKARAQGIDIDIAMEADAPVMPPTDNKAQEIDDSYLLSNTELDASDFAPPLHQQKGHVWNTASQELHDWHFKVGQYEEDKTGKYFNKNWLAQNPKEVSQFGLEWGGVAMYSDMGNVNMLSQLLDGEDELPDAVAMAQLIVLGEYDKLPEGTWAGTFRMMRHMAANPTTFGTFGSLSLIRNLAVRGGKKRLANSLRQRLWDNLLSKAGITGRAALKYGTIPTETALIGAFFDHVGQRARWDEEQLGPFQPDWQQTMTVAGITGAVGGAIQGVVPAVKTGVGVVQGVRQRAKDASILPKTMGAGKRNTGDVTLGMGVGPTDDIPADGVGPTLDDARLDTRQSRSAVQERLAVLVPPEARVSTGQKYVPGQPDGTPWSALPDEDLAQPGPGWTGTDTDIDRMLEEAIAESSAAAQTAAAKTNFSMTMRSGDWDRALRLPIRAQLWYELSGEAFKNRIPVLAKSDDDLIMFTDVVGVTSPREKPLDNLRRSLAVLSQHMRGVPMDVDLTNPPGVTAALGRQGQGSAVASGNKTGHFSDTVALVGGADVPAPIPVNDVWVGKIFGVTEDELKSNQSLHEPMSIFFNKMRDYVNAQGGGQFPHESWQLQSRAWVDRRGAQDDYVQALDQIVEQLREAGVPGITKDGKISEAALRDPRFVDVLRPTIQAFREAPTATIEVGTTQTPFGAEAARVATQLRARVAETNDPKDQKLLDEYNRIHTSALYHATRGKNPFQKAYNYVMGLAPAEDLTRMRSPRADRPYDVAGSYGGVISPNVRVPLRGMSEEQVTLFNAITGAGLRQDAMASSRIRVLDFDPGTTVAADMVEGRSIFIPMTEPLDGAKIEQFYKLLPEGFEISTDRVPNGYVIDINPRFGDDGPVGATSKDVRKAVKYLENDGLKPEIMRHEYKSVYNEASEYPEIVAQHKEELLNGVIKELNDKFGWTEARSRRFINGRGMGKVTKNVRQKVTRIRARYKGRLGDIDAGIEAYTEVSDTVEQGYKTWLSKQGLDAP